MTCAFDRTSAGVSTGVTRTPAASASSVTSSRVRPVNWSGRRARTASRCSSPNMAPSHPGPCHSGGDPIQPMSLRQSPGVMGRTMRACPSVQSNRGYSPEPART